MVAIVLRRGAIVRTFVFVQEMIVESAILSKPVAVIPAGAVLPICLVRTFGAGIIMGPVRWSL
jgi:hypothetical protein